MTEINQEDIDKIYDKVKSYIDHTKKLDSISLTVLITEIIILVDNTFTHPLEYKQEIITRVISRVISDSNLTDEQKKDIDFLVKRVTPLLFNKIICRKIEEKCDTICGGKCLFCL